MPIVIILIIVGLVIWGVYSYLQRQSPEWIDPNLLQAVRGNRALAKRLLKQARHQYPGKSDRWYVEKVIYDLERDGAGSGRRGTRSKMNREEVRDNLIIFSLALYVIRQLQYTIERLMGRW